MRAFTEIAHVVLPGVGLSFIEIALRAVQTALMNRLENQHPMPFEQFPDAVMALVRAEPEATKS
jgi:hypothetical protein